MRLCSIPILVSLACSTAVSAELEVISVTAERFAVAELKSPYSLYTLYQDQIIDNGSRTIIDAFKMVPGVLLQKTAHGQGSP